MISTESIIYCVNPDCQQPINSATDSVCASCQTPLVHRYLWAKGKVAAKVPVGMKVGNRYEVIKPQVWLDTQPGLLPTIPSELPQQAIAYLRLYPEWLHIPQPYGIVSLGEAEGEDIWLLENVPIDETGNLYPTIVDVWEQATATRQIYWLWQMIQLWTPLSELGMAKSLLLSNNLRVQGWCVKLLELDDSPNSEQPSLEDLGRLWQTWLTTANTAIAPRLGKIVQQMLENQADYQAITTQLNELLLATAAELPLSLEVAGATDPGLVMPQNEDTCYPCDDVDNSLLPYLAIVCDGIGGHAGGEVASQLAVQSLKLQVRALLTELAEQREILTPDLLQQQLTAGLRVVNNVIWSRNDEQKRQGRERMATTLVMALQVPQRVTTISGQYAENTHELYLANVGDSRAYWITHQYCQLLTIDDDLAMREIRSGRNLYRQARQRPDAHILIQALGTKEAESLRVATKRLILEEDGILLLCTDGLSDNHLVEQFWRDYAIPVFMGKLTVQTAAQAWVQLAKEKNGQDNASVVMIFCRVRPQALVPVIEDELLPATIENEQTAITVVETADQAPAESLESELALTLVEESPETEAAVETLDEDFTTQAPTPTQLSHTKKLALLGGVLVLLLGGISLGLFAWWRFYPQSFHNTCRQLPPEIQQLCSRQRKEMQ
ncbi:MAG TPA: protein phosphatase 2C domain-containing protein [Nostocaceae cyanobacterium]|nr:protein phosphatase 2C domain-containing protein [Nostocaceae cyanobacterium]